VVSARLDELENRPEVWPPETLAIAGAVVALGSDCVNARMWRLPPSFTSWACRCSQRHAKRHGTADHGERCASAPCRRLTRIHGHRSRPPALAIAVRRRTRQPACMVSLAEWRYATRVYPYQAMSLTAGSPRSAKTRSRLDVAGSSPVSRSILSITWASPATSFTPFHSVKP
jgi:hypothetical protein